MLVYGGDREFVYANVSIVPWRKLASLSCGW